MELRNGLPPQVEEALSRYLQFRVQAATPLLAVRPGKPRRLDDWSISVRVHGKEEVVAAEVVGVSHDASHHLKPELPGGSPVLREFFKRLHPKGDWKRVLLWEVKLK